MIKILFVIFVLFFMSNTSAFGQLSKDDFKSAEGCASLALIKKLPFIKDGENLTKVFIKEGKVIIHTTLIAVKMSNSKERFFGFMLFDDKVRELLISNLKITDAASKKFLNIKSTENTKAANIVTAGDPLASFDVDISYNQNPGVDDVISIDGHAVPVEYDILEYNDNDCKKLIDSW